MRRKKWIVSRGNKELASLAERELGADALAALIVTSRGCTDISGLEDFFDTEKPLSFDPLTIKDMDKAAARINAAIDNFESICVFGDYDADGVTSTALLYSYLESRGANVIWYIPDRVSEGYGLNNGAILSLKERGVHLIVTVDNGVTANDEIEYAYSLGMQVVVTDHHQAGDVLPVCEAVVDPHRPDCGSAFKEMSGVGVAFKLVSAMSRADYESYELEEMEEIDNELIDEYGELVALGTIGDVVSLTGENRIMVMRGIRNINEHPGIGIAALIEKAGIKDKTISSASVAYSLCPRINAAGRMGSAGKALELLLSDDEETARYLADEIASMNSSRQTIENDIYAKALELIDANPSIGKDRIIVVDGEGWHQGVVGIVAAKITEHFGRPSVVISSDGVDAKGSARSIEGFSIYDAIASVSDILTHFGGHPSAAGVGMKSENIPEFRRRINEYAKGVEMPFAVQRIDCRIIPSSINTDMLYSLSSLEPYGAGNPQPFFGLFGVIIEEISGMSEGKHTRIAFSKNGARANAVMFGMPDKRFPFEKGNKVDLAVHLEKNIYNGDVRISTIIRGIRPSDTDEEKVLHAISIYDKFDRNESLSREDAKLLLPDRETQVSVFRSIKAVPLRDFCCEALCLRLGDDGSKLAAYKSTVKMMAEMGVLAIDENNTVFAPENPAKVNLEDSEAMKRIKEML